MCDICKMKRLEVLNAPEINASTVVGVDWSEDFIREKFEGNITVAGRAKNSKGKYINSLIENQWKGFQWGFTSISQFKVITK